MSEGIPAANRNLPAKDQTIDGNTTICVETANALQSIKEMESKKQTIDAASTSLQYKSASSGKQTILLYLANFQYIPFSISLLCSFPLSLLFLFLLLIIHSIEK